MRRAPLPRLPRHLAHPRPGRLVLEAAGWGAAILLGVLAWAALAGAVSIAAAVGAALWSGIVG